MTKSSPPAQSPEFYKDCPFTLRNPQGETLFSLFIKRGLYKQAEELLPIMSKALSSQKMNEAINIRRVDSHFKKIEKKYDLFIERSLFVKGDTDAVQNAQHYREKMQKIQRGIHEAVQKNRIASEKAAREQKKAAADAMNKKAVEHYYQQLTLGF